MFKLFCFGLQGRYIFKKLIQNLADFSKQCCNVFKLRFCVLAKARDKLCMTGNADFFHRILSIKIKIKKTFKNKKKGTSNEKCPNLGLAERSHVLCHLLSK
jgi:hypothetical protein